MEEPTAKRQRLAGPNAPHGPTSVVAGQEGLCVLVLDVEEGRGGAFHLWGRLQQGQRVLLRVGDYRPHFYVAAPVREGDPAATCGPAELEALRQTINAKLPANLSVARITEVTARPIMFYRPAAPAGSRHLQLDLPPGQSAKRAASAVHGLAKAGALALPGGWDFRDRSQHETEVKPLMRFMVDASLGAGSWVWVPAAGARRRPAPAAAAGVAPAEAAGGAAAAAAEPAGPEEGDEPMGQEAEDPIEDDGPGWGARPAGTTARGPAGVAPQPPAAASTSTAAAVTATAMRSVPLHEALRAEAAAAEAAGGGFTHVEAADRISHCDLELAVPFGALQSLTPDATELADPGWCPQVMRDALADQQASTSAGPPAGRQAGPAAATSAQGGPDLTSLQGPLAAAAQGAFLPLKVLTIDVVLATADGASRAPVATRDSVVVIACGVHTAFRNGNGSGAAPEACASFVFTGRQQAPVPPVMRLPHEGGPRSRPGAAASGPPCRAEVHCFAREADMLRAWREWLMGQDPDVLVTFQVRDTLGALATRWAQLQPGGTSALHLSRLQPRHGKGLALKSVVMYSPNWVKSQQRMASTSNQETFRTENCSGRLVLDVLRQVLTGKSLSTFTLADCAQSLLGETLEHLAPEVVARLLEGARAGPGAGAGAGAGATGSSGQALVARLARFSLSRVALVQRLSERLATLPEALEMARVTGLTVAQVCYNAQMIRTWSLLHRNAHRHGIIVGGPAEAGQLSMSPHLMHPIECHTNGLYRKPVASLDFASLYPSLFRAANLCYTTLVVQEDVEAVGQDNLTVTPSGHAFLKPQVRRGVLPSILAALMDARARTRELLKQAPDTSSRAVLDARQKSLKLVANALYGFTGAQASPLQCVPLADSCLSLGAETCKRAIELVNAACQRGALGPQGAGGRVIYAQTDSVFVLFPECASTEQALALGKQAARMVTEALGQPPIELKFERVFRPFMLLHVNRYAGRAFEAEGDGGKLVVKGIKSMWRQSAPFVQTVLHGSLERIIMREDVPSAVGLWAAPGAAPWVLSAEPEAEPEAEPSALLPSLRCTAPCAPLPPPTLTPTSHPHLTPPVRFSWWRQRCSAC